MTRKRGWVVVLGAPLAAIACVGSGQELVELDLEVQGTATTVFTTDTGVSIELERADLAFGPLVLCPGAQAGDLCDVARLEWLGAAVVDARSDRVTRAGVLVGATGVTRSWMYDLGIASLLSRDEPLISEAAAALGGASVILSGAAEIEGVRVPFVFRVVAAHEGESGSGVPLVRKSASETFEHEVTREDRALRVQFDPRGWLATLPARVFFAHDDCSNGEPLACDGTVESLCEAGHPTTSRDCAADGLVCAPGAGCAERVDVDRDSPHHATLVQALVAGARPTFEFR